MNLIIWLVLGLVAGLLARFFFPGPVPLSLGQTLLLGLAGSLLGGFLGDLIDGRRRPGLRPAGLLGSVIGAILVIIIFRALG
ncbi:MAG TPA: GlsB/YeaQ/YmgE family stress response membrane protein [Actinomycetota bacterium]|jgi:uncharacterized membrane protein YeaQ/YmgE (transglycosylase-associated protein family)|nr:GlsB/YeaQ/YmgE family stress response membrane protein [Actinomycetota bacterium]